MVTRVSTVAFEGIEARVVDVQVQISSGAVAFMIVGLPDKAVAESRERVRSALIASGLALPAKRITVNLAPADLPKEGSHYDLPIALAVMAAIGAIPPDALAGYVVLGELGLDGTIAAVAGVLPAAIAAYARGQGLICPAASGPEAAWAAADIDILAPRSLIVTVSVSATTSAGDAAALSTGQVQVMSPTVRKRTCATSLRSPACSGVTGVTGTSRPRRRTTSRSWA